MDEMGVFPRLVHHSTSVMKHRGNVLSSVSCFHSLHCFSFISPHTQPFTLSSLVFLRSLFCLSLAQLFFPLPAPPALCLSLFLYIVWYNFRSSFRIIPRISFSASLIFSCAHTLALFSPNCFLLAALPIRFCRLHI